MNAMMLIQFLVLTAVVSGVLIFFLKKILFDSTQGAVNRLNKETEEVRAQQAELKEKIKQANEELEKRKKEADELVAKMKEEATEQAKEERDKLLGKARAESEDILIKAQGSKDDIRAAIRKEMEMQTAEYSAEILNSVFSQKAKATFHEVLITEFLEKLKDISMEVVTSDVKKAEIITAIALSEQNKQKISSILAENLGRTVELESKEDPEIISGAVLRLGSLALDGSLKTAVVEEGTALKEKIEKS